MAAGSGRASPRLALRRRLSSSTTTGSGPPPLESSSPSASPEPSTSSAGGGGGGLLLHAEPPLPPGWGATATANPHAPGGLAGARRGYLGHYVVLCGYDPATHAFAFRDPAAGPGEGAGLVGGAALDAARWAWGTDEDLLLVELAG
jgi:hypothetical protein